MLYSVDFHAVDDKRIQKGMSIRDLGKKLGCNGAYLARVIRLKQAGQHIQRLLIMWLTDDYTLPPCTCKDCKECVSEVEKFWPEIEARVRLLIQDEISNRERQVHLFSPYTGRSALERV